MESELPQAGASDLTGVSQHLAHVETAIGDLRDHVSSDGAANFGQLLTGRHPTSANEALESHWDTLE
jgi:hypothetical protein